MIDWIPGDSVVIVTLELELWLLQANCRLLRQVGSSELLQHNRVPVRICKTGTPTRSLVSTQLPRPRAPQ